MRWGLIPSWASGATSTNFNARSETVTVTPSFRDLIETHRCLIPADAFYEWKKVGTIKQPFAFEVVGANHSDKELFAFAGLWDEWKGPNGLVRSCTILTTEPNSLVAELHDRMPVIVERQDYGRWLNPDSPLDQVLALLKPFGSDRMHTYPVSTALNNSQNEGPDAAVRVEIQLPSQGTLF